MDKKRSTSGDNSAVIKPKKHHSAPHFMRNIGWYFAILIVAILIVIMAVPSVSVFSSRGRGEGYTFGKFGNRKIEFTDGSYMLYAYNGIMQQYSQYFDNTQLNNMQMSIMQQAFQTGAVSEGTSYYASSSDMTVTDKQVDDYIKDVYTGSDGKFNRNAWASLSTGEKARIRRFAKNEIIQNSFIDDIKTVTIPKGEIELIKSYKQEQNNKDAEQQNENNANAAASAEGAEETPLEPVTPVIVTDAIVIKDIRDTATERYSSALLSSPKLTDNFVETYNNKILPIIEANKRASEEAEANAAVSTVEENPNPIATDETTDDVSIDGVSDDSVAADVVLDDAQAEDAQN